MGILEMFNPGIAQNPLYKAFDSRRSTIGGLGAGMIGAHDIPSALRASAQGMMQGGRVDMQDQMIKQEEARRLEEIRLASEQKNETLEYFRNQRPDLAAQIEAGLPIGDAFKMINAPQGGGAADMPANVREWEYFNTLSPEDQGAYLRMKRSNPYLDVGTGFVQPDPVNPGTFAGGPILKDGDVPTGFQQNPGGGIQPMPGSQEDTARQQREVQAQTALAGLEQKNSIVLDNIDRALEQSDWLTTGFGSVTSAIPGTPAYDLKRTLDTIKANIGFEELQTMRDNSPTGGALGQVTERELAFLQSTIANIEQAQSQEQLKRNLKVLKDFLASSQQRRRAAFQQQYSGAQQPVSGGSGSGWTVVGVE